MISIKNGKVLTAILVFIAAYAINAANLRVSKQDGPYKSIMAAIKDAKPGDSVIIVDAEIYEEQVTIDSTKNGLVLTSENPLSKTKPTIKWKDIASINPKTCQDAQDEAKSAGFEKDGIYYDQNGTVRILRARGITIDGIIIDGGGAYPFVNTGVWGPIGCNGKSYDLFHGNSALDLWIAGDIIVKNSDIQNAYFGINIKDRNVRGIFANPNPSDIARENIVPLSGFGKTGNHVFENNRIHNNSWGMFFESAWDLGSVIRYNLIYENHHASGTIASSVAKMGSEGQNQVGGGILFKDVPLSPLAIYNNTFWHNAIHIAAQWQAGASHLVFNNIFAQPLAMWQSSWKTNPVTSPFNEPSLFSMETAWLNRLKHNSYAAMLQMDSANVYIGNLQIRDPETGQNITVTPQHASVKLPVITNDMRSLETGGYFNVTLGYSSGDVDTVVFVKDNQIISPGAVILGPNAKPFPADSKNRWLEPKFKSTDPDDADFLVPDWDDTIMMANIVDMGWEEAGIRDLDGTIADLGAIPYSGYQKGEFLIKPTTPVIIDGKNATVSFNLYSISDEIKNPVIKYVRWLKDLPRDTIDGDSWGKQVNTGNVLNVSRAGVVTTPAIPATPLKVGLNTLTFTVDQSGLYAFFEIVVEGKNSAGETVTSGVGFLPYRKLENVFSVKLYPPDGPISAATELTSVQVGEPYRLQIIPQNIKGATLTFGEVKETELSMISPYKLLDPDGKDIVITGVPLSGLTTPVMFTKIPDNGWDVIKVNGIYIPVVGEAGRAIMGTSAQINIKPGPPAKILFQAPPSNGLDMIYPGSPFDVKLQVYDKYDNKVKTVTAVKLESSKPEFGDVDGSSQVDTDTNGIASLKMKVTDGDINDTIPIVGTLVSVAGAKDNAKLIVGKPKNRYFIFYSDTTMYDSKVTIPENSCTGMRVPVQIRASTNGLDTLTDINNEFTIEFNPTQIVAFATDSENDTVKITAAKLTKGIAKIYIQAVAGSIRDGMITITDAAGSTPRVVSGNRKGINFTACNTTIKNASYTANNGNGAVDQLDVIYTKALKASEIPDSLEIFWPTTSDTRKMVMKANMTIDPQDSAHLIVTLPETFPDGITGSSTKDLGTSYWKNPNLTETAVAPFKITDKVGPIIKGAWLIERLTAGKSDTLIVAFSEFVQSDKVTGEAFQLTTKGGVVLNVLSAIPMSDNRLKIAVENKGDDKAPKEGDSLKIYVDASGVSKVVDDNGNYAHKDNRPVELIIQEIAPSIDTAAYYDKNGDGTVDSVTLKFNKKVKIGDQSYLAFFGSTLKTDTIKSNSASYIDNDSTRVALDLTDKFKGNVALMTSGDMTITVESKRFSEVINKKAEDRAAPVVIDSAWYCQGKINDDETRDPDTLRVKFSEQLKTQVVSSATPFTFFTSSGQEYTVDLTYMSQAAYMYEFKVNSVSGTSMVMSGDKIMIKIDNNTSPFADLKNNAQGINPNRKALIGVKDAKIKPVIKVGPSPFVAKEGNSLNIMVTATLVNKDKPVDLNAKVMIVDNMGNCIFVSQQKISDADKKAGTSKVYKELKWNGRNKKGRLVGVGTYLIYIDITAEGGAAKYLSDTRKIAVKRE